MGIRLYDSAVRQVRAFVPLVEGQVGIYVCGATPQSSPHIGHVRAQVDFDVLRRWFVARGAAVTYVRNVTDIEDKILSKAAEAGRPWWAHAFRYEQEFTAAYDALGVLRPTYEPRATGHMTEMVELMARLVDAGHAYAAPDGSGDVYFDVPSFAAYGALTRQGTETTPDDDVPAVERARKRDVRDFALWKGRKDGEPATASWPTPWGPGRPGWHLECSAMATRYLGAEFDIHGGGIDLRFPHHENELAQSRAAGDPFARYWMHNAWVVSGGEKMSKSLGNTLAIATLLQQVRPVVLRYLLVAPHYRSHIEIGDDSMAEATAAYERIEGFVTRAVERLGPEAQAAPDHLVGGLTASGGQTVPPAGSVPDSFAAAMDDDLGTPAAVAVLHERVRAGNTALAEGDLEGVALALRQVRAMSGVLGVDPLDVQWHQDAGGDDGLREALDALVRSELQARATARKERDFAAADAIRDRLTAAGVQVEDTADGARWTVEAKSSGR